MLLTCFSSDLELRADAVLLNFSGLALSTLVWFSSDLELSADAVLVLLFEVGLHVLVFLHCSTRTHLRGKKKYLYTALIAPHQSLNRSLWSLNRAFIERLVCSWSACLGMPALSSTRTHLKLLATSV